MSKVCQLRQPVFLRQRIGSDIRRKLRQVSGIHAPKNGHALLRDIAELPTVEVPLRNLYDRGRLGVYVPYFKNPKPEASFPALDLGTAAHTFLVCEAAQNFMQENVDWFFNRSLQAAAPADYRQSFAEVRDLFGRLRPQFQNVFFYIALLHDIGKAVDCAPFHFHHLFSGSLAQRIFREWGFPAGPADFAVRVIRQHTLMGSFIVRDTTPSDVLETTRKLSSGFCSQQDLTAALLAINLCDVRGQDTEGVAPGVIKRYSDITSPERFQRLNDDYYSRRLEIFSRSFEDVSSGKEVGEAYPEVLEWVEKLVPAGIPEERADFEEAIGRKMVCYGFYRILKCLSPKNKVKLLKLVSHLRSIMIKNDPAILALPFNVLSKAKDGLGRGRDLAFEIRINNLFDAVPDSFTTQDVKALISGSSQQNLLGIPIHFDRDAVSMDFTGI